MNELGPESSGITDNHNGRNGGLQRLKCMKYTLMVINSFGVLLGFFIVLFGMAYKEEIFPGGYKGKETAMFAGVFIFFSLIGYCGASQQKNFFLIPYVLIIFIGLIYNLLTVMTSTTTTSEKQGEGSGGGGCLDAKTLSLSGLLIVLLSLASFLIFRIRRTSEQNATQAACSMDSMEKTSTTRSTSSFLPKFSKK